MAKDLLRQVVGRYLARETEALQVLHSIKILALQMAYALRAGEWGRLGALLDRHWELNKALDPHTTNPLIDSISPSTAPTWLVASSRTRTLGLLAEARAIARSKLSVCAA